MIINPHIAIKHGWVSLHDDITEMGVTLEIKSLWKLRETNNFRVHDNVGMMTRGKNWVEPVRDRTDPEKLYWRISDGYYEVESKVMVDLPPHIGIMIYALPEMLENGIVVPPTIYEGGWKKPVSFSMDVHRGTFYTSPGTNIATMIFVTTHVALHT